MQDELVERCVEAMREHLTVCSHSGFIEGFDEAARAIIPIVQAGQRKRDAVIAENTPTPWDDDDAAYHAHCVEAGAWSNAGDAIATAIRNQEQTDG